MFTNFLLMGRVIKSWRTLPKNILLGPLQEGKTVLTLESSPFEMTGHASKIKAALCLQFGQKREKFALPSFGELHMWVSWFQPSW